MEKNPDFAESVRALRTYLIHRKNMEPKSVEIVDKMLDSILQMVRNQSIEMQKIIKEL